MKENKIRENLIYGRNPVKEALTNNQAKIVYLVKNFNDDHILRLINEKRITVKYVMPNEMMNIAGSDNHQGCAAEVKGYSYSSLEEIIKHPRVKEHPIIVMLDGIEDPHNLGAILRCCDVFAVSGVIIPKHNSVSLNATVAKTSAGAINYVPVAMVGNLNNAIKTLQENGYWVVASDGSAKQSYNDIKYDFPTVLVIGSEGRGVSKLVLSNSDYIVKIPQYGNVNSLNASVATGILLSKIRG